MQNMYLFWLWQEIAKEQWTFHQNGVAFSKTNGIPNRVSWCQYICIILEYTSVWKFSEVWLRLQTYEFNWHGYLFKSLNVKVYFISSWTSLGPLLSAMREVTWNDNGLLEALSTGTLGHGRHNSGPYVRLCDSSRHLCPPACQYYPGSTCGDVNVVGEAWGGGLLNCNSCMLNLSNRWRWKSRNSQIGDEKF